MKTLVFASNNAHKLEEIRAILSGCFDVKSLKDIGCEVDIPETGFTFRENALQKATYVKEHFGLDCFADDSGLQVEALGGEPGVFSARYATKCGYPVEGNRDDANMNVLLEKLAGETNRKAKFSTCVALIYEGETYFFEGEVKGKIIDEKRGDGGFGYDPIFVPEGHDKTFAELGNEVKNGMSHRARAVAKLAAFLKN
jgi:XTP/dITP diphosphohydrolase